MFDYNFDYDEGVLLESEDVSWASRDYLELDKFVLTNKKLYCAYEKSNGLFKKPTNELNVLLLSDIKIINGQALVQQTKYEGDWCLQIQFRQGTEYFEFSDAPKKVIPLWISAINNSLGIEIPSTPTPTKKSSPFSGMFAGAFAEVADNFKSVIDTAAETLGIPTKSPTTPTNTVATTYVAPTKTVNQSEESRTQNNRFCVECGNKLMTGTKFCPNCGCKVDSNTTFVSQQETVQEPIQEPATVTPPIEPIPFEPVQVENAPKEVKTQRQQEYVGKIFKCPHCGGVVNQFDAICSSCGFHLSGKEAIGSAMDFQQQLLKIEMTRQNQKVGFWDQREALDATDKQIIALIKSYPIPNSIEDIVEFFHLAIGNIDVAKSKKSVFNTDGWDGGSRERAISNAWVGKMQQIYKKAELFFPNEPEFAHVKEAYSSIMKELKL